MYIYFVRHGQTLGNMNEVVCGHFETPLSDLGIQQAKNVSNKLSEITFDLVFSSDLSRAFDTANIVSNNQKDIIVDQLLRERNYGEYDGKNAEVKNKVRDKLGMSEYEFTEYEPSIETNLELVGRFKKFMKQNLENIDHNLNKNILVVSHGGFIRVCMAHIMGVSDKDIHNIKHLTPLPNCSICILELKEGGDLRLVTYNQHDFDFRNPKYK